MGNARLPIPGKDEGRWGDILNEYLLVSHTEDGSLRSNAPTAGVVDEVYVTNAIQGKVNRSELSAVATTGSYGDLLNKPDLVVNNDARLTNTRVPTDNTVTTNKLVDGSVTEPKLAATNEPSSGDVLTWSGTALNWQVPASAPVQSVNGRTGAVVVTKSDLSLDNVNNTSDVNKPISSAMQTALDLKIDADELSSVATSGSYNDLTDKPDLVLSNDVRLTNARTPVDESVTEPKLAASNNPSSGDFLGWNGSSLTWTAQASSPVQSVNGHTGAAVVTKSDIGLGNADNTSDANKPISSATQAALDLKANTSSLAAVATTGTYESLSGRPTLATVATSGSYADLTNKPTIPAAGTTAGTYAAGNDARITGAIQSTTVTAKGDLLAATGSSSLNRVAVGSDGQVLVADSSQSTGVRWGVVSGGSGITRSIYGSVTGSLTAGATANTDYVYIVESAATITMPDAVANTNQYVIKSVSSAADVTIAFTNSQSADGSASITLQPYESITLVSNNLSDGAEYWVVI